MKQEKEYLKELYNKYGKRYKDGNEDDFILRYFVYRGLYERIVIRSKKLNNKFKLNDFLELFTKTPLKFQGIYESIDNQIKNKTLDIDEFKLHILDHLDGNQIHFLNDYGETELWDTMSGLKTIKLRDYIQQIEYEFMTISYLNFSGYFNITLDYIQFAKQNGIAVGPGRGSAAGSLISYLTYITDVDSLKYELLFERMLHILKAKDDIPDVDVDFEPSRRYDVIEYVKNKFGENNVCHIGNYLMTKIKSQFKDMTRHSGINYDIINRITKSFGNNDKEIEQTLKKILTFFKGGDVDLDSDITSLLLNNRGILEPIFNILGDFTGFPKIPGIHACGVIIAPIKIEKISSCRFHHSTRTKVGFLNKVEFESSGLLKFDFLGLQNMEVIKNSIKGIYWKYPEIRKKYGIKIIKNNKEIDDLSTLTKEETNKYWESLDWYTMYFNIINNIGKGDKELFEEIFSIALTTGIFQFESDGMKRVLKQIKPNNIMELTDMNALYRPGPLQYIPIYKDNKFEGNSIQIFPDDFIQKMIKKYGKKEVYKSIEYYENIRSEVTKNTNNIFVYQEQLMFFFYLMGNTYTDSDYIRKIYMKIKSGKKSFEDLIPYYKKTIKLLEQKGVIIDFFDYIYTNILLDWAEYGFNKSHAVSYTIIAYINGWLKYYYPYEFYTALLRIYENEPKKITKLVNEMNILGINIEGPNLKNSKKHAITID